MKNRLFILSLILVACSPNIQNEEFKFTAGEKAKIISGFYRGHIIKIDNYTHDKCLKYIGNIYDKNDNYFGRDGICDKNLEKIKL